MAYSVKSMILYNDVTSNGNESMDRLNSIYRDELWLTCMEEIEFTVGMILLIRWMWHV